MKAGMSGLTLTYSMADQDPVRTKSLGIFNLSLHLGGALAASERVERITWLANRRIPLPTPNDRAISDMPAIEPMRLVASSGTMTVFELGLAATSRSMPTILPVAAPQSSTPSIMKRFLPTTRRATRKP